jgi:hypothetical protein
MVRAMLAAGILALVLACLPGCGSGGGGEEASRGGSKSAGSASINNNDPRAASAPAANRGPMPGQMLKGKKPK